MCMILSNKETDFYIFKQVTHNLLSQVDASPSKQISILWETATA